jgi:hypothetical protein
VSVRQPTSQRMASKMRITSSWLKREMSSNKPAE